jgi:hypothetical protein
MDTLKNTKFCVMVMNAKTGAKLYRAVFDNWIEASSYVDTQRNRDGHSCTIFPLGASANEAGGENRLT